ncbi:aspartate aminotransferase family protein [Thalassobacillus pellis]|uniref:aspartate aminotransferase family protein n=1 Tax=Thalassobacillus pellis TaxID=748008 RepID=UPI0019614CB4|nr:aspartate aminotransferase family protein [Thalassobacillus pellis]MBM7553454.1 glutamate-1-semialdehyde 2,1-aminomutase [Thalassobacillus pellis]
MNSAAQKEYMAKTQRSREFSAEAKKVMPGGVTANIKSFDPYPAIMKKGKGAWLYDVDGNEYIDYLLSYGALMLGHGHPVVKKAIHNQMEEDGTNLFGTPHHLEIEMGKKLQELYPSMELLRYTNSGTEATLLSIRIAKAYTGKQKIAKFEGHYHGGYNEVLLSVNPPVHEAGPESEPKAVPESKGLEAFHEESTIVLPFNDLEAAAEILSYRKDELAAVMLEPVQGGFIPAEQSFMEGLRKITEEMDILLIFDEVKTGFRLGLGGAQEMYRVKPDMTALGKVVGGGFPVGMVGGRKDVMMVTAPAASSDVFDASQSTKSNAKDVLFHSGTYNGHPTILAAGLATIRHLEQELNHVYEVTERLKNGITDLFAQHGISIKTVGKGSIFNVVITEQEEIKNYRQLQQADFALRKEIDFRLLAEGIYTKPLNRYSVSTVHGEKEVNRTLNAYEKVLEQIFRK